MKVFVRLIHVGNFYRFAYGKRALVGFLQAHYQAEKRGLAGTVRTDDTHNAVGRKHKVEVIEEQLFSVSLLHVLGFDNLVAEARTVGDKDFELFFALLLVLVEQTVVARQTSLALGVTSLGSHTHPFKLALKRLAALACLLLFLSHALCLLVEPRRVVTLPWNTLTTVKFKNPAGHMVEEVAVVSDRNHRAGILLKVLLEPVDRLSVEVVGRLVEEEDIGLLEQEAAKSHAATLTTRESGNFLVFGRTA